MVGSLTEERIPALARDSWQADFRVVSTTMQPTATARFVAENGHPAPQPA